MAYISGDPVTNTKFYGRKELLEELIRYTNHTTYFLNGIRRVGKSSVMKEVARQTNELNYYSVYLSLEVAIDNETIGNEFGRNIRKLLELKGVEYQAEDWRGLGFIKMLENWIIFCKSSKIQSFLLIDEAEKLHNLDASFIGHLKSLIGENRDVVQAILTGTHTFWRYDSKSRPDLVSFEELLTPCYIGMVSEDEARSIIAQNKITPQIAVQESTINQVLAACGGHPFLIQKVCLPNYIGQSHALKPFEKDIVYDDQLERVFRTNLELFNDIEQRLLKYLPIVNNLSMQLVEEHKKDIQFLENIGIIKKQNNRYNYYSTLFEEWMRKEVIKKKIYISYADEDQIHYDDFKKYVGVYIRNGLVELTTFTDLDYGEKSDEIVKKALKTTDIWICLISPNTWEETGRIKKIEERFVTAESEVRKLQMIPILIEGSEDTFINGTVFEGIKYLPSENKSLSKYPSKAEGWEKVANDLKAIFDTF